MISEHVNESGKAIMFLTHTHTQTLPDLALISDSHTENGTVFWLSGVTIASLSWHSSPKQSCWRPKSWLWDTYLVYRLPPRVPEMKTFLSSLFHYAQLKKFSELHKSICSLKTSLREVIWKIWNAILLMADKKNQWKSVTLQRRATCLRNFLFFFHLKQ